LGLLPPYVEDDLLLLFRYRKLTLSVFACFLYSYFPVVYFIYPETTQRTLEDMDEIFKSNPGILVYRNKNLTQRARPEAFKQAEQARIIEAATHHSRKDETGKLPTSIEVMEG
jgi:hypothetical protein